ncbi:hypothetical protein LCGC14_2896820, partial [marine sediment metagenome]
MTERLTVREASAAYESAMRNIPPLERGICTVCRTFIDPEYDTCYRCMMQSSQLDVVVPITYSEHLGQMHTALRNYKDGYGQAQSYAMVRLAAILWRFLEAHETCVSAAAGASAFEVVTTVPSSTVERDDRRANLRTMVGWCKPLKDRYRRVLRATGEAPSGRAYDESRYKAAESLEGRNVLLIDDTWAGGGHAQSAAHALRAAGAERVGLVVIGRHVHRDWKIAESDSAGDRLDALPRAFDWD